MKTVLLAAFAATGLGLVMWFALYKTIQPPTLDRRVQSVSYNFVNPGQHDGGEEATRRLLARVDADLTVLSGIAQGIRLYAATGVFMHVPQMAQDHGLNVTVGAWVDADASRTRAEIEAAIAVVNRVRNVRAVSVGNEALLRKNVSVQTLIGLIREVRRRVRVPVTTSETWDIWLKHPELAREVDVISAHILPYWEFIDEKEAIHYAFERYADLRAAFPGKRIVIAEFGWPSRGTNNRAADPGPLIQADVLRGFLREAHQRDVGYNIVEAIDQPWKTNEGSVGPYWGILNANRQPKFAFSGSVRESHYWTRAAAALAIGALVSIALFTWVRRKGTFLQVLAVSVAAQALAVAVATALFYPVENYLNPGSAFAWGVGFLLMIPLTTMTLLRVVEVAEATLGFRPRRLLRKPPPPHPFERKKPQPKVSIHVPAYRENPEVLNATLDSLAALDYRNFEVLVIVNNTPEPHLWKPVEAHCKELGPNFRFVYLTNVKGYKAGALNTALPQMAADTEIIALLDADYVVHPNWLRDLVPAFNDPRVGMVQAPQDHRDGEATLFKTIMNSEYAGFFDIGMVFRNEDNAIITHGTMVLVRRKAFDEVKGWSSDTITEDTEFGLRILSAGYSAHYTNRRYGHGLLPDSFHAFCAQRDRWVAGAMQIIRKHWRLMLPRQRELTAAQKYHFVTGWAFWISDAVGVLAAVLNLVWVPMILFVGVLVPAVPFTVPILSMFAVNLLHCSLLYTLRVRIPPSHVVGAALAAMSLQLTVARAVAKGLFKGQLAFLRTEKGGLAKLLAVSGPRRGILGAEGWIGLALAASASAIWLTNDRGTLELNLFAATLAVQCLPFLSAPLMVLLERYGRPKPQAAPAVQLQTP